MGAEVVSVANDGQSAQLSTGETLTADVIIGAGGPLGVCRKLLERKGGFIGKTGKAMYQCVCNLTPSTVPVHSAGKDHDFCEGHARRFRAQGVSYL